MSKIAATGIKNMANPALKRTKKKIGNTTYIITAGFNGDKNRSLGASLARLIRRDASSKTGAPKISA